MSVRLRESFKNHFRVVLFEAPPSIKHLELWHYYVFCYFPSSARCLVSGRDSWQCFCYDTLLTQADDFSSFLVNSVPVSRGLCRGGLGH